MTQEEAIKVLEQIRQWTDYPKEALTMAIEALSKLELPPNLDEAAEEYYDDMWDDLGGKAMVINYEHDIWYPSSVIETVFKAGAEWMARQGVTVKGLLYGGSLGIPDIPEEFYTDKEEEVIVQIRKK